MPNTDDEFTEDEIAAVANKLADWGAGLPPKEQAIAELLAARARLVRPDDVMRMRVEHSMVRAVHAAFRDLGSKIGKEGWVRIDPIWYKSGATPGEEVEFTTTAFVRWS